MVVSFVMASSEIAVGLIAQAADGPTARLKPADGAKLLAVFMGLVILGIVLMVLAWMGARATRRYMHSGPRQSSRQRPRDQDDWSKKPLDRDSTGS
jgi:hypothetical protein